MIPVAAVVLGLVTWVCADSIGKGPYLDNGYSRGYSNIGNGYNNFGSGQGYDLGYNRGFNQFGRLGYGNNPYQLGGNAFILNQLNDGNLYLNRGNPFNRGGYRPLAVGSGSFIGLNRGQLTQGRQGYPGLDHGVLNPYLGGSNGVRRMFTGPFGGYARSYIPGGRNNLGYEKGYVNGYDNVLNGGFNRGYSGYGNEYDKGSNNGYGNALTGGFSRGFNNYGKGYDKGSDKGYGRPHRFNGGFNKGYNSYGNGYDKGSNKGYGNALNGGFINGYNNYGNGYDKGSDKGYGRPHRFNGGFNKGYNSYGNGYDKGSNKGYGNALNGGFNNYGNGYGFKKGHNSYGNNHYYRTKGKGKGSY